jgi:exosortase E/protease (VPEID-CTERM system)
VNEPAVRDLPLRRWSAVGALLLGDYLAISLIFDVQPLRGRIPWLGWSGEAAEVASTAILALWRAPAGAAVARLRERLRRTPRPGPPLLVHGVALVAFFSTSHQVLSGGVTAAPHPLLLAVWALLAAAVVGSAVAIALALDAVPAVARLAARPAFVGIVAGVVAWAASRLTEALWPHLARATLEAAALLLRPFAHGTLIDEPGRLELGLGSFVVQVSAGCSGVQGMGLMAALSSAYLMRFRRTLRFPAALAIVPIGVAGACVANVFRIAALIAVGHGISPAVAMGGFHSKAGWILTCALALGLLAWVRRSPALTRGAGPAVPRAQTENPAIPYLLPLLVNLGLALATGAMTSGFDLLYPVRLAAVAVTLAAVLPWKAIAAGWRTRRRPSGLPLLIGAAVFPLWLAIARGGAAHGATVRAGLAALSAPARVGWLAARALGAAIVAPVTEELAFRGFLLRRLVRPDFDAVDYGAASRRPLALIASALAFGALHKSLLAGTLAGAAYGLALRPRRRLADAVLAHAVTNALLVALVLLTSRYGLLG